MNTIEFTVVEVLSEPYYNYLWCVDVMAESWGVVSKTTVHCTTIERAAEVRVGYKFDG